MEQLLLKMARQLDSLDEASLMALWDKYALLVSQFEPTKRWEEATLVFELIQAKHWKNQLFNHQLASLSRPGAPTFSSLNNRHVNLATKESVTSEEQHPEPAAKKHPAEVLKFVPCKPRKQNADEKQGTHE